MTNIRVGNTTVDLDLEPGDLILDTVIICRIVKAGEPETRED